MNTLEASKVPKPGANVWPLSVAAYHALGEADLVPERTELLPVSSHDYDRSKLRAYAEAQVKECWLVLGPERQIEAYRHPVDGRFAERVVQGPGGQMRSSSVPEFILNLASFFAPTDQENARA